MFQAPITNLPELVEKYIKESLKLTISEPLALMGDQVNVNEDYAIVPVRVENTGTLTLTNLRFFITAPDSNNPPYTLRRPVALNGYSPCRSEDDIDSLVLPSQINEFREMWVFPGTVSSPPGPFHLGSGNSYEYGSNWMQSLPASGVQITPMAEAAVQLDVRVYADIEYATLFPTGTMWGKKEFTIHPPDKIK